jgi:hypothetical protein
MRVFRDHVFFRCIHWLRETGLFRGRVIQWGGWADVARRQGGAVSTRAATERRHPFCGDTVRATRGCPQAVVGGGGGAVVRSAAACRQATRRAPGRPGVQARPSRPLFSPGKALHRERAFKQNKI